MYKIVRVFQTVQGLWPFLARLYESTGRAIALFPASAAASAASSALTKMLKFYSKFLRPHIF